MTTEHHSVDHFMLWLHGVSPCMFARTFASQASPRIVFYVVPDKLARAHLQDVESTFDGAAVKGMFAGVLFPRLRYPAEIADLLAVLERHPRWSVARVPWRKFPRDQDTALGLQWQTREGEQSSVMGFAPLGSMPVSRRAPYVGIVGWPGTRDNSFAKSQPTIGFIDGKHGLKRKKYDTKFKVSGEKVGELFGDPQEDRIQLRKVAFCLPRESAKSL